jgi:putative component of membrane protein insertase Oxa1/YidC/SpoIIIJ protein YidD
LNYYQKEETQMNGDRCPLYPTCSQYAKEQYEKNKFLGFFLTFERLFIREIGDLSKKFIPVPEKISPTKKRFFDPPENSFEKPSFIKEDY